MHRIPSLKSDFAVSTSSNQLAFSCSQDSSPSSSSSFCPIHFVLRSTSRWPWGPDKSTSLSPLRTVHQVRFPWGGTRATQLGQYSTLQQYTRRLLTPVHSVKVSLQMSQQSDAECIGRVISLLVHQKMHHLAQTLVIAHAKTLDNAVQIHGGGLIDGDLGGRGRAATVRHGQLALFWGEKPDHVDHICSGEMTGSTYVPIELQLECRCKCLICLVAISMISVFSTRPRPFFRYDEGINLSMRDTHKNYEGKVE